MGVWLAASSADSFVSQSKEVEEKHLLALTTSKPL